MFSKLVAQRVSAASVSRAPALGPSHMGRTPKALIVRGDGVPSYLATRQLSSFVGHDSAGGPAPWSLESKRARVTAPTAAVVENHQTRAVTQLRLPVGLAMRERRMTGELAQPAVVLSEQPHLARPKAIWEPVARQYANPGGTLTSSMVDCAVRVAFAAAAQTPMRQLLDDFSPCERGYLEWYAAHADQPQQDGMPVVVEAGAGVGFHALRMARAGLKVTAREINPELVRALQARLEQPEYESVARVLRCEAGSGFAGVSVQGAEAHLRCDRLLCYLSEDERRALFEDARRVAGMRTFALRTYDRVQGWNQYEPLAPVRWLTDLPELMALARAAGLTVARASYRVEGFDRIVNSDIYGQHGDPIDAQAFCDALAQDVDRAERHPALLGVQALTSVVMQRKH